jgi:hypothetical protein
MRRFHPGWRALALAAIAAVLAGCGGQANGDNAPEEASDPEGVGEIVTAGSTAQFATCRDWRKGTRRERYETIEDLRGQLTPQTSETEESDLSDENAYELFQHSCAAESSDSLRLYKLYARFAAFAPLTAEP